jgi:spermidine/putrescine-binding protein
MLRRAIAAALLATAATATAILPAAPAQARACTINFYCYTTFYADSAHTVVVGQKYEDCDGTMSMWGVRSPYLTFSENPC